MESPVSASPSKSLRTRPSTPVSSDDFPEALPAEIYSKMLRITDQQNPATATDPQQPLINMESIRLIMEMSQYVQTVTKDLVAALACQRELAKSLSIATERINYLEEYIRDLEGGRLPQELEQQLSALNII
ncbi:hypothetical protein TWF706_004732 [Orbilia oligospora]|nr:hypothetical protein TWF706_004732 [Orbilia oligospora]